LSILHSNSPATADAMFVFGRTSGLTHDDISPDSDIITTEVER
jgi:hypothetical protein